MSRQKEPEEKWTCYACEDGQCGGCVGIPCSCECKRTSYADEEGPICPQCGDTISADEAFMFQEEFELDCPCGASLKIQCETSVAWRTYIKE